MCKCVSWRAGKQILCYRSTVPYRLELKTLAGSSKVAASPVRVSLIAAWGPGYSVRIALLQFTSKQISLGPVSASFCDIWRSAARPDHPPLPSSAEIWSGSRSRVFSTRTTSPRIAPNLTCRGIPTLGTVSGDLSGSWPGCSTWGTADFGAISRDFDRKISRPRKSFENFGQNFAENRTECHVPRHADARQSDLGPLRLVGRL